MNDLPPELLEKIFLSTLEYGGPRTRAPSSASLSQTCHRWRAVALACGALWSSDLPYRSPDWTELCLSRCTSVPLDVNVVHDTTTRFDHGYHAAVTLALKRLNRTRSLGLQVKHDPIMPNDVAIITSAFLRAFKEMKKNSTYGLSELSIGFSERGPAMLARVMVPLIMDVFANFAPISHLETITLVGCTYNRRGRLASRLMGSHLRQLTLVESLIWDSIDSAITALQAMPKLEILHLQTSEQHFDPNPSRPCATRCIKLPNLKLAFLRGLWQENIALFSYLAIPPRALLDITSDGYMYSDSDPFDDIALATVANATRRHFAAALAQEDHYKEVMISGGDEFITIRVEPGFGVTSSDSHTDKLVKTLPDALELSTPWAEEADTQEALLHIFSTLPIFTAAETINLDPFVWKHHPEIYNAYTNVRLLKIEHVEIYLAYHDQREALFPALTHLIIIGAAFEAKLLDELVDRLLVSHPLLGTVEFRCCKFSEEAIAVDHAPGITEQYLKERGISTVYTHVGR